MRLLFISFALLLVFPGFSQDLKGIGTVKIGVNINDVIGSMKVYKVVSYGTKIKKGEPIVTSRFDIKDSVYAIQLDTARSFAQWPSYLDGFEPIDILKFSKAQGYYLPFIRIGNEKINDVYLFAESNFISFIYIPMLPDVIENALREKYTPSSTSQKIDTIKCKYVFTGAVKENFARHKLTIWENSSARGEYVNDTEYGNDCKISMIKWHFQVFSLELWNRYNAFLNTKRSLQDYQKKDDQKKLSDEL